MLLGRYKTVLCHNDKFRNSYLWSSGMTCAQVIVSFSEWQTNPVLINIETTDYSIENIPFPAVTFCPEKHDPSCFEIVAKIFDYVQFPIFEDQ